MHDFAETDGMYNHSLETGRIGRGADWKRGVLRMFWNNVRDDSGKREGDLLAGVLRMRIAEICGDSGGGEENLFFGVFRV